MDRRTKRLTARLRPGEVAVIDHLDLDRASAVALVAGGAVAVVNAAPSVSGRYPNLGPEILVAAGVPLLDNVGTAVFSAVRDGDQVRVDGAVLYVGEEVAATGTAQDARSVSAAMAEAHAGLHTQLDAFAANTVEYLLAERGLLLDGVGFPEVRTDLAGRHVVVVLPGPGCREDLTALRSYLRDYRPVLVGVDEGADALLEVGHSPDLIVGDVDAVSDEALRCGAEVVVRARADGPAPGLQRVQDLGVDPVVFRSAGTSEDVALLLADDKGASLIVAVGTHATLLEFLDRGRQGMASTFLTRLRLGGKLVDAHAVCQLYRRRVSGRSLLMLAGSTLAAVGAAIAVSPAGLTFRMPVGAEWHAVTSWLAGLFR